MDGLGHDHQQSVENIREVLEAELEGVDQDGEPGARGGHLLQLHHAAVGRHILHRRALGLNISHTGEFPESPV